MHGSLTCIGLQTHFKDEEVLSIRYWKSYIEKVRLLELIVFIFFWQQSHAGDDKYMYLVII